jgi:hypothetical protein
VNAGMQQMNGIVAVSVDCIKGRCLGDMTCTAVQLLGVDCERWTRSQIRGISPLHMHEAKIRDCLVHLYYCIHFPSLYMTCVPLLPLSGRPLTFDRGRIGRDASECANVFGLGPVLQMVCTINA